MFKWIAPLLILTTIFSTDADFLSAAGSSSSLMQISADGELLVCTNRDSGTATVIDLKTRQKLREITLGHKPEGLTFLGTSHQCAACIYGDDRVVVFDADSGKLLHQIDVFDEPYGIVSNHDGSRLYACLEYPSKIVEIDPQTGKISRQFDSGKFPRGLALAADDQTLYVTEYLTGSVISYDVTTGKELNRWPGLSTDNLARQIVLHPTLDRAYMPHMRSKIDVAHGEGSIFPYVTIIDTKPTSDEKSRKRIPMDSFRGTLVTANPWECDLSPDGQNLYVVFGGTDDVFVCDVLDDNYRELVYSDYIRTGHNPRAVKVAPDGKHFYIYNALDFQVVEYSTQTDRPTQAIDVCKIPYSDEHRTGKILFYTALQPMTGRRWISCSSCHPDGDSDGRTWQNPEGLRNTPSLAGVAWTHPLHWSADRDETQDFEHTIRGPLMQGRGLVQGQISEALGDPLLGQSPLLDALTVYNNSHKFPLSPYAKKGLSESATRGRELFFSKNTRCAECHKPPFYADSNPAWPGKVHDVDTGRADASELMGPKYDTPTLLGLYRTAPYLHHGKAETLRDVLVIHNPNDKHGVTSHLNDQQLDDLVEYLKALPYEDPVPAAKAAGLKKVER
ncbi:MAG: c-type cytochrome [Planctomycetaceae bacterium]|nr:c-type cytochrome [Planctomycetaceae bacterium]